MHWQSWCEPVIPSSRSWWGNSKGISLVVTSYSHQKQHFQKCIETGARWIRRGRISTSCKISTYNRCQARYIFIVGIITWWLSILEFSGFHPFGAALWCTTRSERIILCISFDIASIAIAFCWSFLGIVLDGMRRRASWLWFSPQINRRLFDY